MGNARAATLRAAAGSLLVVGLEGVELTRAEAAWLRLIRPSGIILFRRNIETAEQTHSLLQSVRESAGAPLFRCVDVEGGTVDRLRDLVAPMPSAAAVGAAGRATASQRHGRLVGRELGLLGFNTTFAPVLDLETEASRAVLSTRTASSHPESVVAYARAFLQGLAKGGVLGCGKHFPGLGSGNLDSHRALPVIERQFADLWAKDLAPYRKLSRELALVMVAHAAYPQTKSRMQPASISPFWIGEVLKKKIGYRGLVLSDDMEMGGILSQASLEEAVVKAVLAGTHLVEICRDPALILEAYEALLAEAERSAAFAGKVQEAAAFVNGAKRRLLGADPMPRVPRPRALEKLRAEVRRFAEELQAQQRELPA